jgi:SAM-dependent methyltransferase
MIPDDFNFSRYLEAKRSVDDRSLNRLVWETLLQSLPVTSVDKPLKVIEVGAGIGTMLARMVDWDLIQFADYTGIDLQAENIEYARHHLARWARGKGLSLEETQEGLVFSGEDTRIEVNLVAADIFTFIQSTEKMPCDLFVAHAFLDLVPLPNTIVQLFNWLQNDALFYFSINYDGLTVLEPVIDETFDDLVLTLYHDTMKERNLNGQKYGDHQTGRHLLDYISQAGGSVLAAGGSDWIVHPIQGEYRPKEGYFLHYIINTIYHALYDHPLMDQERFSQWIDLRHQQVEQSKLVYIAHQVDFCGKIK